MEEVIGSSPVLPTTHVKTRTMVEKEMAKVKTNTIKDCQQYQMPTKDLC